ncbi:MAG: NADH-ubiquinone oxidoreductase-F iron-sulfur binding region domain-containing protein [Solirubrobacteraceae bacterium]
MPLPASNPAPRPGPPGLPRLLVGLDPSGATMTLADHQRAHGPLPVLTGNELIAAVERSGLRGRGGADFPAAVKLRAVADRAGRRGSVLVVNGSETEPASSKDRLLLSRLPHLVLDGAVLAAAAVGAREILVKVGERATAAHQGLHSALAVRDDGVRIQLVAGPEGYIAGEESAVVNYLANDRALPTFVPPRPFERGYRGRPTLIQNPETLAQIALVARYGDGWYRELGTEADPGSALVTIVGAVAAPGVYELAFGTPMTDLLSAAGGSTEPVQALLVGGYFGTWVESSRALRLRLARNDLRSVGCSLGSGVLAALGESACGLHESARVIDYLADQSAGQCGPCVFGLRAIADSFAALADGVAHRREHERVLRWCSEVRGRGACHHPDGAVRFVESALGVFGADIGAHRGARCHAAPAGLPLPRRRSR